MFTNKLPSAITPIEFYGQTVYIKRDDLVSFELSGNKFRKLYYYLDKDLSGYKRIVSYGGAQSNAMLSIAKLAKLKGLDFEYYLRYLPQSIKDTSVGNFALARALGMKICIEQASNDEALRTLLKGRFEKDKESLFIAQGGAMPQARYGLELLAKEILAFKAQKNINNLAVITPSGTGTSSLYLQHALGSVPLFTVSAVASSEYLKKSWQKLEKRGPSPHILETKKRYRFAKPYKEFFKLYDYLLKQGVEFDLIYAPVMWQAVKEHQEQLASYTLLYVHSGGVSGNVTQLQRYQEKILPDFVPEF